MRAILTYHSIDRSGSSISVHPDAFAAHVSWLASGRVRTLSVAQLAAANEDADAVAVTFDDGFTNFATEAAPLLRDHGIPVTLFVVTDHVGRTNAWRGRPDPSVPTLPLLDWGDLAHLAGLGVEIGAHTRTHPNLALLPDSDVEQEIGGSVDRLKSELGIQATVFAYPYGATSAAAVRSARRVPWACTTELRVLSGRDDPSLLPRLDMYYFGPRWPLSTWGSPAFRAYLAARRAGRRVRTWARGDAA